MEENQVNELTPASTTPPPTEVRIGNFIASAQYSKIMPDFVDALNEIESAIKDSTNPHLKNKYADLTSCLAVVKPALKKYNMTLCQPPHLADDMKSATIGNVVLHKSGQYIRWDLTFPVPSNVTPQQLGTLITYNRRYSLPGLGIMTDEDDDGNSSSNVTEPRQQQRREPPPPPQPAKAAAKPKQEAAKPVEDKPQPKPEPQTELGAYLSKDDELQKIITSITQKHTGVTPAAIDRFMETTQIKKQPIELQIAFMSKYSENRDFSMVATQWTRTGKTFQECFDEAVAKGPTVWRDSIKSA